MGNGASTLTKILEHQGIFSKDKTFRKRRHYHPGYVVVLVEGRNKRLIFNGNKENAIINGEILLEERVSLFDGRTNPIHCFSVDDLNSMNVDEVWIINTGLHRSHRGVWEGMLVLVKIFSGAQLSSVCREIAVATQMGTHRNVHRLLGCCLDTAVPVLVYQWEENGILDDRILKYNEHGKSPLEWKERLRIAWEIAHALAYLHTAFPRPIIHRDLKLANVFLDQDDSARLTDFSMSISIPEGEDHVEDDRVMGTIGYIAPEYLSSLRIAESADVFAFGKSLLVLVTGKPAVSNLYGDSGSLVDWVRERANCHYDIVDPVIINKPIGVHLKHELEAVIKVALSCTAFNEESRPSVVDVATQLKNMMSSSDSL